MTQPASADQPLSAADSLALINSERTRSARRNHAAAAVMFGAWGLVYVLSWGSFYLVEKGALAFPAAMVGTGVLVVAMIVFSAWRGVRMGGGVRGPSQVTAAMYGCSWTISYLALTGINVGLQAHGLSQNQVILLWSGTALLLAGALSLAGGALFHSWVQYGFGAWTMLTAAGSVVAGVPGNFLVLMIAGGGGFFAQAAVYLWLSRRVHCVPAGPFGVNVPAT